MALWKESITVTLVNGHTIKLTSEYSSLSPYVSTDPRPLFFYWVTVLENHNLSMFREYVTVEYSPNKWDICVLLLFFFETGTHEAQLVV